MTTIALEQFPPAVQALFKAALHDTEAVITEIARVHGGRVALNTMNKECLLTSALLAN